MKTSMQSTNKPRPPVPSSMDVCDLGGGSGQPRLHTGGAKNLWVKKNHHIMGERLKIATYNVRTLLKDERVQELKENNMNWDVMGLGEVRRKEESFTTLQSGHLLYHSEVNNGQSGVGFLINKKWKDNITRVSSGSSRVAELVLRITDRYQLKIVQVYAPTISHSDEETDNFYNTIDKILEKQTHVRFILDGYIRQSACIQWEGVESRSFNTFNGVKQGGVISPILFSIYYDKLITRFSSSRYGCRLSGKFVGPLAYADDITLLCPSLHGL